MFSMCFHGFERLRTLSRAKYVMCFRCICLKVDFVESVRFEGAADHNITFSSKSFIQFHVSHGFPFF